MASSSKSKIPEKPTRKEVYRNGSNGFRSKEEFNWWSYYFHKKPVVIERPVQIDSFTDFPHRQAFVSRPGWVQYLADSGNQCNLTICTEFVASLIQDNEDDDYSFTARVRNKYVPLNPTTLGEIMNIEPMHESEYQFPYESNRHVPASKIIATFLRGQPSGWTQNSVEAKDIHKDNYLLWLIVANAIQPTSHTNLIKLDQARIMHAIATNKPFCLVRFFIKQIASAIDSVSKNEAIKMGILITRLCLNYGVVSRAEDLPKIQRNPLNKSTVRRSEGHLRGQGVQQNVQGDNDSDGADTAEHVPATDQGEGEGPSQLPRRRRRGAEGPVQMDMDAIMARLDQMGTSMAENFQALRGDQQEIRDNQIAMRSAMDAGFAYMQGEIEALKNRFPPPPPDY